MTRRSAEQDAGRLGALCTVALAAGGFALVATAASAYPGGTPWFQTDAAPFCAGCHSSRTKEMLEGMPGDLATKQLAENKHLPLVEAGEGKYGELSEDERQQLIAHVRAVDEASTIELQAPEEVAPGETFEVTASVTGGAGPAVGVALVDTDHRWRARPAPGAGWRIEGPPQVIGADFREQTEWLERRPEALGRNLAFVNVKGLESDAAADEWAQAKVIWTLRAPDEPGSYPLSAAYWYGTEKASPLGTYEHPVRGTQVRGGGGGHSGRILFAPVKRIAVGSPSAAAESGVE